MRHINHIYAKTKKIAHKDYAPQASKNIIMIEKNVDQFLFWMASQANVLT